VTRISIAPAASLGRSPLSSRTATSAAARPGTAVATADGGFSPGVGAASHLTSPNLHLGGSDLFVDATVNGIPVPLHLDTGANETSLSASFTKDHPNLSAGLPRLTRHVGGAGGVMDIQVARLEPADIGIGYAHVSLHGIDLELTDGGRASSATQGRLGEEVLRSFGGYTIDFSSGYLTPFSAGGAATAK
jgi:hypothetical protein